MGRRLGQHFLKDEKVIKQILLASSLTPQDVVLEIGPGKGILTRELCQGAGRVIAIELDPFFAKTLKPAVGVFTNLEVIQADALEILRKTEFLTRLQTLNGSLKVVSNIPYQITTPLLYTFIFSPLPFQLLVLLIQREVAEKLMASPGSSKRTALSVLCQIWAEIFFITEVPRTSFHPSPKVDGAVIKLQPKAPQEKKMFEREFLKFLKIGFSSKRKKLVNVLSAGYQINKNSLKSRFEKCKLDSSLRAEDLTCEDWLSLYHLFH